MTFNFDYPTKVTDLTFGQVNSVTDLTWKSLTFWPFSKNLHAVLICQDDNMTETDPPPTTSNPQLLTNLHSLQQKTRTPSRPAPTSTRPNPGTPISSLLSGLQPPQVNPRSDSESVHLRKSVQDRVTELESGRISPGRVNQDRMSASRNILKKSPNLPLQRKVQPWDVSESL